MSKYQISCPGCNVVYNVGLSARGKTSKCRKCQTDFVVPDPPADLLQHLLAQQAAQQAAKQATPNAEKQPPVAPVPVTPMVTPEPKSANATAPTVSSTPVVAPVPVVSPTPVPTPGSDQKPVNPVKQPPAVPVQPATDTTPTAPAKVAASPAAAVPVQPSAPQTIQTQTNQTQTAQSPPSPVAVSAQNQITQSPVNQPAVSQPVAKTSGAVESGPQKEASPYESLVNQMMSSGQGAAGSNGQTSSGGSDYLSVNRQLNRSGSGAQVDDSSARLVFRGMSFMAFGLILFGIALLRPHLSGASLAGPISAVVAIGIGMIGSFCILIGFRKKPGTAAIYGFVPIALFVSGGVWAFDLNRNDHWKGTTVANLGTNTSLTTSNRRSNIQNKRGTGVRTNGVPSNGRANIPNYGGNNRNNSPTFSNPSRNSGNTKNFGNTQGRINNSGSNSSPAAKNNDNNSTAPIGNSKSNSSPPLTNSNTNSTVSKPPQQPESDSDNASKMTVPKLPTNPNPRKFVPEPYVDPFADNGDSKPFVNPFKSDNASGRPGFPGGMRGPTSPRGGPPTADLEQFKTKVVDGVIVLPKSGHSLVSQQANKLTSDAFMHFRGRAKDHIEPENITGPIGVEPTVAAKYLLNVKKQPLIGFNASMGFFKKAFGVLVPVFSSAEKNVEIAKAGYLVGGLNVYVDGETIKGVQCIYMRKKSRGLNTEDFYLGNWISEKPDDPSNVKKLDAGGKRIFGVIVGEGRGVGAGLNSLSIVHEK